MALKPSRDKIENNAIKRHDNQNLSNQHNRTENKKKSKSQKTWSQHFYELDINALINNITVSKIFEGTMGSYYNPNNIVPNYSLSYTWNQWDLAAQMTNQLYPVPVPTVPVAVISPPISILPTVMPYTDVVYTPTYPAVVPYVADNIGPPPDLLYEPPPSSVALTPVTLTDEDYNEITEEIDAVVNKKVPESLDYYLNLPKNLFPKAKMLTLDPNPIIDELCKIKDLNKHSSWILDLEFGLPRNSISRPLAVYDVQSNNIHCKNTPGVVHPVFETCSEEFRTVFLFYYDCIVSVWYRGYIHLTNDDSVINFQNWLVLPMQALGMCWA